MKGDTEQLTVYGEAIHLDHWTNRLMDVATLGTVWTTLDVDCSVLGVGRCVRRCWSLCKWHTIGLLFNDYLLRSLI